MARRRIIAGNWKMNKTPSEAVALCAELKDLVKNDAVDVVYCVPAIDIIPVAEAVKGTNVKVGAQNFYIEDKGAFTGEIAAPMLKEAGVEYIIIGHSERRDIFGENDILINAKVKKAFASGLKPILCCGESLSLRKAGTYKEWIARQIKWDLDSITADQVKNLMIAYEPIWAIGTGETATSDQAEEVCKMIREIIGHSERRDIFGENDILINAKVKKAFAAGLKPILCCGESLALRKAGTYKEWIARQIKWDLDGVSADQVKELVIAYEPIWAIGTGETATADQAQEVCGMIREIIAQMYDAATAEAVRIQYGGSMNAGNAAELLSKPDIDGGLIGGASLKADFGQIVNA